MKYWFITMRLQIGENVIMSNHIHFGTSPVLFLLNRKRDNPGAVMTFFHEISEDAYEVYKASLTQPA
jgi:hypothetical protein